MSMSKLLADKMPQDGFNSSSSRDHQQQRGQTTLQRDVLSQLLLAIQQHQQSSTAAVTTSSAIRNWQVQRPVVGSLQPTLSTQALSPRFLAASPTSRASATSGAVPWLPLSSARPLTAAVQEPILQSAVPHQSFETFNQRLQQQIALQQQNTALTPVQQAFLSFICTVASDSRPNNSAATTVEPTSPTAISQPYFILPRNLAVAATALQQQQTAASVNAIRETALENTLLSAATLAPHLNRTALARLAAHVVQTYETFAGGGNSASPEHEEDRLQTRSEQSSITAGNQLASEYPFIANIGQHLLSETSGGSASAIPHLHRHSSGILHPLRLPASALSSSYETSNIKPPPPPSPHQHYGHRAVGSSISAPPRMMIGTVKPALVDGESQPADGVGGKKRLWSETRGERSEEEHKGAQSEEIEGSSDGLGSDRRLSHVREFAQQFKMRRLALGLTQTQVGRALTKAAGPSYSQSAICR